MSPSGAAPASGPDGAVAVRVGRRLAAIARSDSACRRAFRSARAAARAKGGDRAVPQGPGAAEREQRDQPIVDRAAAGRLAAWCPDTERALGPRGVLPGGRRAARVSATAVERRRAGGRRGVLRQARRLPPGRSRRLPAAGPPPRRRRGGPPPPWPRPPPREPDRGSRRASVGTASSLRLRGPGLEGSRRGVGRGDDERADRVGLERNRSPPPDQERAERQAGMNACSGMPARRRARAARGGRPGRRGRGPLHHLVGVERAADDAFARRGARAGGGSRAGRARWSGVPLGTDDRRAVRAGVREGAVDRQETGLG